MKKSSIIFTIMILTLSMFTGTISVFAFNHSIEYSNVQIEIEKDLVFIFEEATKVSQGKIIVSEQLLANKYGEKQAKYMAESIRIFMDENRIKE